MRVPRTFLFTDLTGFTNFTAHNGDDAAGRLLSSYRLVTREVASAYGVRVAKWLGDGAMLVALNDTDGICVCLETAYRALHACAPLAMRAGIASGRALLFEGDDYIGSAVNLAARLCDAAGPGEVLMPAANLRDLPKGVRSRPNGAVTLRGFPDPIEVVSLSGRPITAAPLDAGEIWPHAPFVA
ncbi:MAG: adenylate/guanylate cyclase domain-containing protein [Acidimicrobiia bacterium]